MAKTSGGKSSLSKFNVKFMIKQKPKTLNCGAIKSVDVASNTNR